MNYETIKGFVKNTPNPRVNDEAIKDLVENISNHSINYETINGFVENTPNL